MVLAASGMADERKVVVGILELCIVREDLVDEEGDRLVLLVALYRPACTARESFVLETRQVQNLG